MTVPMVDCPTCKASGALPGGWCGTCSGAGRITAHKAARLAELGTLTWKHEMVSDGSEYFANGPPACPVRGFIYVPFHGQVPWEVRSPSGNVIAEGNCPTFKQAKVEAEAFIVSLAPTPDALAEARDRLRQRLLAIEADLAS